MAAQMRTVIILLLGSCARTLAEGSRHHSDSAGVTPLVALARNGTDEQKARAAHALWTLAFDNADNIAIAQAGGIPALVALARDGTTSRRHMQPWRCGTSQPMQKTTRRSHVPT